MVTDLVTILQVTIQMSAQENMAPLPLIELGALMSMAMAIPMLEIHSHKMEHNGLMKTETITVTTQTAMIQMSSH